MEITARPMNQRTGISLNGKWDFTPQGKTQTRINVPDYWDAQPEFASVDRAAYERVIDVPDMAEWRSKILKIEFEGVNFIADVSMNGKPLSSHVGGWIPLSVDVTRFAKPGASFRLKVDVRGGCHQPVVDA
jgi:beta-galactosidase/beta-glucuronidase